MHEVYTFGFQDPSDKEPPVAVGRIFLAAHDGNAMLLKSALQTVDSASE